MSGDKVKIIVQGITYEEIPNKTVEEIKKEVLELRKKDYNKGIGDTIEK